MSVCCSTKCKKFYECAWAMVNAYGAHTATDKANRYGWIDIDGIYHGEYVCGELGGYRFFKPVKKGKQNDGK